MLPAAPVLVAILAASPPVKLEVGMKAPAFQMFTPDISQKVKLEDLKNRPVLLDFFRTDCAPCLAAMPDLVKFAERIQPDGVDVIVVALLEQGEDGLERLRRYIDEHKIKLRVIFDRNEDFTKLYVGDPASLPSTFLLDRDGKIVKIKRDAKGTYESFFGEAVAKLIAPRK
jgi:peroxiredoxin